MQLDEKEFSIRNAFLKSWLIVAKNLRKFGLLTLALFLIAYINTIFEEQFSRPIVLNIKLIVGLPIITFINLVIIYLTKYLHDANADIQVNALFRAAIFKTFRGSSMLIIAMIIFIVLLSLLIIPGIIWLVYVYFALHSIALKDQGIFESFRYSQKLVKGRFWRLAALFIFMEVLPEVLTSIGVPLPIHLILFVLGAMFGVFSIVFSTILFLELDNLNEMN